MNAEFEKLILSTGSPIFEGLLAALDSVPPVSVKLNPGKTGAEEEIFPDSVGTVAWEPLGRYLAGRPSFTLDPRLHQGLYYVQEASSMIHGAIVGKVGTELFGSRPLDILDACAAPGGKTTSVLANMPAGSAVVANEFDYTRAEILKENLYRWGSPAVAVTRGDTTRFRGARNCFDLIVADVPCSGEGMFRKDTTARNQWNTGLVRRCAGLQREIVGNLVPALKPGGVLVYSTCTFNTVENEDNVEYFVDRYDLVPVDMAWPEQWNIMPAVNPTIAASRFLPSRIKGEGLFVAVLRKEGESETGSLPSGRKSNVAKNIGPVKDWVRDVEILAWENKLWAATPRLMLLMEKLKNKGIDFLSPGTEIASLKGHDIVPAHSLALSTAFVPDIFPTLETDTETALQFLRRENLTLPSSTPKGYILLTYRNHPLGFVKNIGNRANNLLPKEWRIRTSHIAQCDTE